MATFIYNQLFLNLPTPTTPCTNKTIIVTGSNTGLGLEAARHFVRLDAAKVILAVRSLERGAAAKKSIEASEKNKEGVVEVWPLDLEKYDSVEAFAKKAEGLERLDVLLENAGIARKYWSVAEGNESTITVNVISTYLLGLLLLPKLRETAEKFGTQTHLSVVSSEVHGWAKFDERKSTGIFETLNDEGIANMGERYPVSKLLEVFATRQLASLTSSSPSSNKESSPSPPVIMNLINPGLCHSELARDAGYGLAIMKFFLARSTEAGSRTLVHAALAGPETHGQYQNNCKNEEPAPLVVGGEGKEVQERVWDELASILEGIVPGVMRNIGV